MTILRAYTSNDALQVGRLIKDTYSQLNLSFLPARDQDPFLGPFQYASNPDPAQLEAIHGVIQSEIVILAEDTEKIVGVIRGRIGRLGSLFVHHDFHRQGIASLLAEDFEDQIRNQGGKSLKVASSMYAVPFYLKMGYKRSTGVREGWSFQGRGLPIQPMKKILD